MDGLNLISEILRRHLYPKGYVNECKPAGINPITCQPTCANFFHHDHRLLCGWNRSIGSCGMIWERFRIEVNLLVSSPSRRSTLVQSNDGQSAYNGGTCGKHQLITHFLYMLSLQNHSPQNTTANIDLRMHTGAGKNLHQLIELVAYRTRWRGLYVPGCLVFLHHQQHHPICRCFVDCWTLKTNKRSAVLSVSPYPMP